MNSTINSNQTTSLTISQLDSFGLIKISGDDNIKFLQGQITTNAETIESGQLALSAICNPQGRCVSLFFITKNEQDFWLILKRQAIDETIATLKKYAVFFKVEISENTEHHIYGLHDTSIETINICKNSFTASWQDKLLTLLVISTEEQSDWLDSNSQTTAMSSEKNWLFELANKRISWLETDSQSQFLPHNLDLPAINAVDFKKGCFTGQEVIARMQYKGKLKSHLQLFHIQTSNDIKPMATIAADDKSAAQVICSIINEQDCTAVLALMKDRYLDSKIFRLNDENGSILELIKSN